MATVVRRTNPWSRISDTMGNLSQSLFQQDNEANRRKQDEQQFAFQQQQEKRISSTQEMAAVEGFVAKGLELPPGAGRDFYMEQARRVGKLSPMQFDALKNAAQSISPAEETQRLEAAYKFGDPSFLTPRQRQQPTDVLPSFSEIGQRMAQSGAIPQQEITDEMQLPPSQPEQGPTNINAAYLPLTQGERVVSYNQTQKQAQQREADVKQTQRQADMLLKIGTETDSPDMINQATELAGLGKPLEEGSYQRKILTTNIYKKLASKDPAEVREGRTMAAEFGIIAPAATLDVTMSAGDYNKGLDSSIADSRKSLTDMDNMIKTETRPDSFFPDMNNMPPDYVQVGTSDFGAVKLYAPKEMLAQKKLLYDELTFRRVISGPLRDKKFFRKIDPRNLPFSVHDMPENYADKKPAELVKIISDLMKQQGESPAGIQAPAPAEPNVTAPATTQEAWNTRWKDGYYHVEDITAGKALMKSKGIPADKIMVGQ